MLQDKIVTVTYRTIGQQEGNYTNAQANEAVEQSRAAAAAAAGQTYATGGMVPSARVALVGERGPELVALPGGARVFNAQETRQQLRGDGGVLIENLTIQVQGPALGSKSEARALARVVYDELGALLKPLGARV
jgi:dihydroxyacid dehydratase/phosphogluconate dehydratase